MIKRERAEQVIKTIFGLFDDFQDETTNAEFKQALKYCMEEGFPFGENIKYPESNMLCIRYNTDFSEYWIHFNWEVRNSEMFESCIIIWSAILNKYATLCYFSDDTECCYSDSSIGLYNEYCFTTFIKAVELALSELNKGFPTRHNMKEPDKLKIAYL